MNHAALFRDLGARRVRYALTGARGGYGRTLLAGALHVPALAPAILCDLDADGVVGMLAELGYPAGEACADEASARAAAEAGRIPVVADHALLAAAPHDIVVEATGGPELGAKIALDAIGRGAHVAMVSKEPDSVVGPHLARLARDRGLVYTAVEGDQPANLVGLVTWARLLGLDVVAAGKASEYDFVFDPATGRATWTDRTCEAPGLAPLWTLGDDPAETLRRRSEALAALPQRATPDYCEMCVVANATGLLPARDDLSYPLLRTTEIADVFRPRAEGGILDRSGAVDVFNLLRRPDEASFGGGVFVVVRCTDGVTWEVLRGKGHVISRDGRHACVFLPYHLMGLETPLTLLSAVLHGRPSGGEDLRVHAVMVARAGRDLRAGEVLRMGGHHHVMEGCEALLLPADRASGLAPFYLAAHKRLRADAPRGTLLREDALELDGSVLQSIRRDVPLPAPTSGEA